MECQELSGLLDLLPIGWEIAEVNLHRDIEEDRTLPSCFVKHKIVQTFLDISLKWRDPSDPGLSPSLHLQKFFAHGLEFMVVFANEFPGKTLDIRCETRRGEEWN